MRAARPPEPTVQWLYFERRFGGAVSVSDDQGCAVSNVEDREDHWPPAPLQRDTPTNAWAPVSMLSLTLT